MNYYAWKVLAHMGPNYCEYFEKWKRARRKKNLTGLKQVHQVKGSRMKSVSDATDVHTVYLGCELEKLFENAGHIGQFY